MTEIDNVERSRIAREVIQVQLSEAAGNIHIHGGAPMASPSDTFAQVCDLLNVDPSLPVATAAPAVRHAIEALIAAATGSDSVADPSTDESIIDPKVVASSWKPIDRAAVAAGRKAFLR